MRFEWFVARRYLRSPYRPAVLRLVTLFSVLGVAAGVATLVIALSMNTGFRETLQDRLLGVTAHISLTRPGSGGVQDYEALASKLSNTPGVRSVTPAVYQTVLLSFAGDARGVVTKGIEPERERRVDEALQRIIAGHFDFAPDSDGIDAVIIGRQLANEWKISPGDYVTLTSPQGRLTPFGLIPRTRRFRVAGVFDSGFYDYDENWCFLTLPAAQSLSGAGNLVNVLEFRLENPERAGETAREIERIVGPGFSAATWMEENRALFRALRLEKLVTAIFIGLITFVAGLNILVVLSMTVTDKARDIAVLMSMGARRSLSILRFTRYLTSLFTRVFSTAFGLPSLRWESPLLPLFFQRVRRQGCFPWKSCVMNSPGQLRRNRICGQHFEGFLARGLLLILVRGRRADPGAL